jgi:5-methylcytosine-specific restriction protein A
MKIMLQVNQNSKIGFKKLSSADLGTGNSHQTHIGLFDETIEFVGDHEMPVTAKFIYNKTIKDLICLLDFIKTPNGLLRSPKIRKGNKNELYIDNGNNKSIVGEVREIAENYDTFQLWFLLWFSTKNSELVFVLFNQTSKEFIDIFEIIPNIGVKGIIKNTDEGFLQLTKYIEQMEFQVKNIGNEQLSKRATRSTEFWLIAFFLSKFGENVHEKETKPPIELNSKSWKETYSLFYEFFNEGQTINQFVNSLKNSRDAFDSHLINTGRIGWRDNDGKPAELPVLAKRVYNKYNSMSRGLIWKEINTMLVAKGYKKDSVNTNVVHFNGTNPNWTREELILALELYYQLDQGQMHKGNPDLINVSNELRGLNIHKDIPDPIKFRNPNSIARRLGNFKTMDEGYDGVGLENSSKLAKEVFKEFKNRRESLKLEATLIRTNLLKPVTQFDSSKLELRLKNQSEFIFNYHKNRESDPLVLRVKKETALLTADSLSCEICGFDPVVFYGEIGNDVLEIHYNKGLNSDPGLEASLMEDFIIVCSNCHKVLDKNFHIIDSIDLKNIIDVN